MSAFATPDDVAARWRPLSISEQDVAATLLDDASDMIRSRWPDIDGRVTAGKVTSRTLLRVVASMVKRAMMNSGTDGVTQATNSAGPFSQSQTFANPSQNLYLTADDIRALDGSAYRPRMVMGWLA